MGKPSPGAGEDRPILVNVNDGGATLDVAGRKIKVASGPVARTASDYTSITLARRGANCLVLQPNWQEYAMAALIGFVGLLVMIGSLAIGRLSEKGLAGAGFGLLALCGGLGWLGYVIGWKPRIFFDRRVGQMRAEPKGSFRPRPLADVVAVQLNRGHNLVQDSMGPRHRVHRETTTYELNVVIDDNRGGVYSMDEATAREMDFAGMASVSQFLQDHQRDSRRVNLACHSNHRGIRQTGRELARFLDVPLVDHTEP
jgi:hypothetical protein